MEKRGSSLLDPGARERLTQGSPFPACPQPRVQGRPGGPPSHHGAGTKDDTGPLATSSKGEGPHPANGIHTGVPVPSQAVSAQTVDSLAAAQALWQP